MGNQYMIRIHKYQSCNNISTENRSLSATSLKLSLLYTNTPAQNENGITICIQLLLAVLYFSQYTKIMLKY